MKWVKQIGDHVKWERMTADRKQIVAFQMKQCNLALFIMHGHVGVIMEDGEGEGGHSKYISVEYCIIKTAIQMFPFVPIHILPYRFPVYDFTKSKRQAKSQSQIFIKFWLLQFILNC